MRMLIMGALFIRLAFEKTQEQMTVFSPQFIRQERSKSLSPSLLSTVARNGHKLNAAPATATAPSARRFVDIKKS
jgi:hypothetical protein